MQEKLKNHTGEIQEDVLTFFIESYPRLQQYCRFLTQSDWDGEDIAQEVMIKALEHYRFQPKVSTSLLNKMAYNHWIDVLRKRKREELVHTIDQEKDTPHKAEETMETIEEIICRLTPSQAVIFALKHAFQYKAHEIAELLGTTEMAIKSTLHRAKNRIKVRDSDSPSIDIFWNEENRQMLSDLFYEALKDEDPSVLIETISMNPVLENKKPIMRSFSSFTSTLSMAA